MATVDTLLSIQAPEMNLPEFIINMVFAAFLSFLLSQFYIRYGRTLSNRRSFAYNFIMVTVTTTFIISIIKSSLALSLGLVGALSIVRFRSAIKEPEELAYLFFAISIGLGFGANQATLSFSAFAIIISILWLQHKLKSVRSPEDVFFNINANPKKVTLENVIEILENYTTKMELKRLDENKKVIDISLYVEYDSYEDLQTSVKHLNSLDSSVGITIIDSKGIVS